MKEAVDLYWELRGKADQYCKSQSKLPADNTENYFGMAFNGITLVLELLNYYYQIWEQRETDGLTKEEIESLREDNRQRVIMIQKKGFIGLMSSFEYCAKMIVKETNLFPVPKRLYLSTIVDESKSLGLISEDEHDLWTGLVWTRNSLVHNNAITEVSREFQYPGATLRHVKDAMLQGDLLLFGHLVDWQLDAASRWIEGANKPAISSPIPPRVN